MNSAIDVAGFLSQVSNRAGKNPRYAERSMDYRGQPRPRTRRSIRRRDFAATFPGMDEARRRRRRAGGGRVATPDRRL